MPPIQIVYDLLAIGFSATSIGRALSCSAVLVHDIGTMPLRQTRAIYLPPDRAKLLRVGASLSAGPVEVAETVAYARQLAAAEHPGATPRDEYTRKLIQTCVPNPKCTPKYLAALEERYVAQAA
jgi:hypothetical protein